MTILNLITSDQHLISAQKIKLASGDINSVQLKVAFDSAWDSHPTRTAVFYTSSNPTKYDALMVDDMCVIPAEVLEKPGLLHIGVRGVSMDGTSVKTSSIAQHKIVQGAEMEEMTIAPSMDLYQQYIAAMDARVDPIFTEIKAQLAEQHAAQMAELTDLLTPVVLWTNESPNEEFAEQTIEMDLSEYKRISVLFGEAKTTSNVYYEFIFSEKNVPQIVHDRGAASQSDYLFARKLTLSNTGIQITDATYPGSNNHNDYVVPIKITGYKY